MPAVLWWTVENTLIVALLVPVVWALCRALRSRPAAQHLLWMLLMVKLIAPPIVDWPWRWQSSPQPSSQVTEQSEVKSPPVAPTEVAMWNEPMVDVLDNEIASFDATEIIAIEADTPPVTTVTAPAPDWNPAADLIGVWSLGVAVMLAWTVRGLIAQRTVLKHSRLPSHRLVTAIAQTAKRFRVRPPRAAVSDRVESPVVACLPRPRLIWPEALDEPEAIAASDGILAHELAHVARRDHLLICLETLILACQWWNPLAWYLRRRLRETRELACDALALAHGSQSRTDYARRLLALSISAETQLTLAPAFGAGRFSRGFLQRRLTMVFDTRTHGRVTPGGALAAALLAAVALPGFAWAFQADSAPTAASDAAPVTATATVADAPPSPEALAPAVTTTSSDSIVSAGGAASTSSISVSTSGDAPATASNKPVDPTGRTVGVRWVQAAGATAANQFVAADVAPATGIVVEPKPNVAQSISLPHGGSMEIMQTDDNCLRIAIRQDDGTSQVIVYKLTNENLNRNANRTWQTVADYVEGGTRATATAAPAERPVETRLDDAVTTHVDWVRATGVDADSLRSDVELAEVNLAEKQAELEIAKEENVSNAKLKLAALAVRRAEIELKRCQAKLNRTFTTQLDGPAK